MLDGVYIFLQSGVVSYEKLLTPTLTPSKARNLVNELIGVHILESRGGDSTTVVIDNYAVEWRRDNSLGFVVVAIYGSVLRGKLTYLGGLLDKVVKKWRKFIEVGGEPEPEKVTTEWEPVLSRMLRDAEASSLKSKFEGGGDDRGRAGENPNSNSTNRASKESKGGKGKKAAASSNPNKKLSKNQAAALDFSGENLSEDQMLQDAKDTFMPDEGEVAGWDEEDEEYSDDEGEKEGGGGGWGLGLKNMLSQVTGNRVLTEADLGPVLTTLQQTLVSKNVASEIAADICTSVRSSLVGKKMSTFSTVKATVLPALELALERVMTPRQPIDILRDCVAKRETRSNSPYTIVFVGINGVGKSTSLAKTAYYLKQNGCKPLIAACDTFRSGAVEQLNVHAKCLDVPLFQKGYSKDPSSVAKAAISKAKEDGNDVVLVDTAGRMQNNVPLMTALNKLIVQNKPDAVIFVCEALVGNDGVSQLQMFSQALSSSSSKTGVDGVILTKFDTVSDKVGSAVTLSHVTGVPVIFVGVGQKYNHLKRLSTRAVVKSLFKD
ncbi:hypothetical protein TrLO_g6429 [Triparma laevis f. longispina]|uniref:SRP54-type proteins GTP-binding domain-containing protein n=2 Tax=Triparma laevis TaxID=1534972 RepID=A0A9W7DS99_9STRA|nr:hypothetical protein TrLO_g6429 [Triparma laevis f. longispina]